MTNGPFKAEDFEAALGVCSADLDHCIKPGDLTWREVCERGAYSANARYQELVRQRDEAIDKMRTVLQFYSEFVEDGVIEYQADSGKELPLGTMALVAIAECDRLLGEEK